MELRLRRGATSLRIRRSPGSRGAVFRIDVSTGGGPDEPGSPQPINAVQVAPGEFVLDGPAGPRRGYAVRGGDVVWVHFGGTTYRFEVERGVARRRSAGGHDRIASPMPGQVLRVLVAAGDRVERGQPLLVVEAMKMQIELAAPHHGVVAALFARPGDRVHPGVPLADVEPAVAPEPAAAGER